MTDLRFATSIRRRTRGRRVVLGILVAMGMLAGPVPVGRSSEGEEPPVAGAVTYPGRAIDAETGEPVEGAMIVLERSIRGAAPETLPAWTGETTIRTDADGRFRLSFPPEQVAEPRTCIAMRIQHPGFIHRKTRRVPLADLVRGQARGEEPFFSKIPLERGVEYTAQVVVPGGKPAAGIPYVFENGAIGTVRPAPILTDDYEGLTDDEGRIRLRMPKSRALALYVGPPRPPRARFPYAPYQHFWGTDHGPQNPAVWAPTDLGRIVLSRGIRLPGRLVDTEGRPIARQTITAYPLRGHDRHSATTEADGTFSLGPLRSANYLIYGEGQAPISHVDLEAPPLGRSIRVVRPVRVYLKEGVDPEPLALHEMPTVRVEVRFVDSKGRPAPGGATILRGLMPFDRGRPLRLARIRGTAPSSELNAPEREDTSEPFAWELLDHPVEGRIVFPAPLGLSDAFLNTPPADEAVAFKYRLDPDGPALPGPAARLGTLEGDRLMTMVAYRAPTVLVSVKTEDGGRPPDLPVMASYRLDRTNYGSFFVRQPDGRYRSQSLMPDHECEITIRERGGVYDRPSPQRVNLPEGGSAELSFTLRKRREPPGVGDPAPPFTVKTIDGRTLSLASLRGKTVLLHFWNTTPRGPDATWLKAIHDRFGKDDRFAMIGLGLSNDPERAATALRSVGFSWPQVELRDRGYDPIVVAYHALEPDATFLIGPDGKLIARGLQGALLEEAVARALAGK